MLLQLQYLSQNGLIPSLRWCALWLGTT